jgi:hypothetical protein
MVQFPDQTIQELVLVNDDGTTSVQIGPGPTIQLFDMSGNVIASIGGGVPLHIVEGNVAMDVTTNAGGFPGITWTESPSGSEAFLNVSPDTNSVATIGLNSGIFQISDGGIKNVRRRLLLGSTQADISIEDVAGTPFYGGTLILGTTGAVLGTFPPGGSGGTNTAVDVTDNNVALKANITNGIAIDVTTGTHTAKALAAIDGELATTPTMGTGFTTTNLKYIMDASGNVHLTGSAQFTTNILTSGRLICSLPSNYAPTINGILPIVITNGPIAAALFQTNGQIVFRTDAGGTFPSSGALQFFHTWSAI